MITVQLVTKPVAPALNDATTVLVHTLLTNRASCSYRFFGTPASQSLESKHVRCDVVAGAHRFQPSIGDHVKILAHLVMSKSGIGVYHCLFTPNPRASIPLGLTLRALRRPIVHTLCSSPDDWHRTTRLLFADRIVTVSAWARRHLEELGVRNVVHIPPGIITPRAEDHAITLLRQRYDLPSHRPCLVFSGDYEYSRAHPVIVAALPEVVRHHPDVIVVFACRPKTALAASIEAELEQQIAVAGLQHHVRFLREVDEFHNLLALATIVVFPVQSLRHKMDIPLTLLQALALRRPIITSTLGPLAELLEKPVGLGVPPGDSAAFARAISELLSDPDRRQAMGAEGFALVAERYSADRMVAAYERLYLSLVDNVDAFHDH